MTGASAVAFNSPRPRFRLHWEKSGQHNIFRQICVIGLMLYLLKLRLGVVLGFAYLLTACVKDKAAIERCEATRLFQAEELSVFSNFMPMSTRYYWIYSDSNFMIAGGPVVSERLVTPRQAFTYANDAENSPRMFQGLGMVHLPDLAYKGDTLYQLNNDRMLRHGDCHTIGLPFLFPVEMGDTALVLQRDSSMARLYRSNKPVLTGLGTFSNNLVLERSNPSITYTFNTEAGLIELTTYNGSTSGPVLRRLLLKDFNRGF